MILRDIAIAGIFGFVTIALGYWIFAPQDGNRDIEFYCVKDYGPSRPWDKYCEENDDV